MRALERARELARRVCAKELEDVDESLEALRAEADGEEDARRRARRRAAAAFMAEKQRVLREGRDAGAFLIGRVVDKPK